MANRRLDLHYLALAGAVALGAMLRFWHLGFKPLWMDEVITAIFSLGRNYHDLPLDMVMPLSQVREIFTFQPGVSYPQIATNLATQSTHPPLFFCLMHSWLGWILPLGHEWVAKLRSLPALCGVAMILAIYGVNRIAFSPTSGIIAALFMAVSPFGVYLSQEARHYTSPMLIITLALLVLMQMQRQLGEGGQIRVWVWLLWIIINIVGLYVHYFCGLAFFAQITTLILLIYGSKTNSRKWLGLILSSSMVGVSFLPWLLLVFKHFHSSDTSWLPSPSLFAPLYQTLISWVLMVIALPVENQPLPVIVGCGCLMVILAVGLGWNSQQGLRQLWSNGKTNLPTFTLLSFTIVVLLQFFAIAYFLGKDITVVPRYHFVYYPSFLALLAASLRKRVARIYLLVGICSSVFVVSNLAFLKPFQPERVAQNMNLDPGLPVMLVLGYSDFQDVALGLSFALELAQVRSQNLQPDRVAFLYKSPNFGVVSQKLSQVTGLGRSPLDLWIVGPGMFDNDFPPHLSLGSENTCNIDRTQFYRVGIPYQLYRCGVKLTGRQKS